jgi:hypothetical protein
LLSVHRYPLSARARASEVRNQQKTEPQRSEGSQKPEIGTTEIGDREKTEPRNYSRLRAARYAVPRRSEPRKPEIGTTVKTSRLRCESLRRAKEAGDQQRTRDQSLGATEIRTTAKDRARRRRVNLSHNGIERRAILPTQG